MADEQTPTPDNGGGTATKQKTTGTEYVVLREIESAEELMELLGTKTTKETGVFAVVRAVRAKDANTAIKTVAVGEETVSTGRYVAPPASSWKPKNVKSVVQLSVH